LVEALSDRKGEIRLLVVPKKSMLRKTSSMRQTTMPNGTGTMSSPPVPVPFGIVVCLIDIVPVPFGISINHIDIMMVKVSGSGLSRANLD
jgi:hypothetical protein